MHIEPFVMERWQSTYEHQVELNLSDSGVHPLTVQELLEPGESESLLDQRLIYTQSNGTPELRDRIANLYRDADRENIEVTNGGAEANYVTACTLVRPGDEVVLQMPNYMQLWGVFRALGAKVRTWELTPDLENDTWHWDLDRLEQLVNADTRLIAICNPNNPTGSVLHSEALDRIAGIARQHDAWTMVDEIYQGAELDGTSTP
ncbi:MAG: aminotransferase class I/II-fold pyridoxal phosphate-dependent enzyme, partial [Planctomycetota bacterium]|nr:aminotransferase class I/II-fold pyridoxal phosphate-dependent enzyme [Planctomycetota bacterium]